MSEIDYYEVLDQTHQLLHPRIYLEIGTRHGDALALALPGTGVIGVDPAANILRPLPEAAAIESQTSDDYFAGPRVDATLQGRPIDFAFVDGMHLFEFALRDFLNIERRSHSGSVVYLHDCLPPEEIVARRERASMCWTGDVWKVLLYLIEERPDLDVCVFDAAPTGLGVIRNLDPNRPGVDVDVDVEAIAARYADLGFEAFEELVATKLDIVRGGWPEMRERLPDAPWQPVSDVAALVSARNDRRPSVATYARRAKRTVIRTSPGRQINGLRHRLLNRNTVRGPSAW